MAHTAHADSGGLPPIPKESLKAESKRYFTFINVILFLTGLTFIELILIILPFHGVFLLTSLIILSIIKFAAVIWYFMHLRWDKKLLTAIFIVGLIISFGTVYALMHLFDAPKPVVEEEAVGHHSTIPTGSYVL